MLTTKQKEWLAHLSNTDKIVVKPYDPNSQSLFEEVKKKVLECLGESYEVLHRGASYLKISGQNEIDIYVPVSSNQFDETIRKMKDSFGEPKSLYPQVRAKFRMRDFPEKDIDVFVVNKSDSRWIELETFTQYLLDNPSVLEKYRKLKEDGNGLSVKKYYTQKIEFLNNVLEKVK